MTLLAHQGGWDELLMVAVPLAAFGALLVGANRRATRMAGRDREHGPHGATGTGTGTSKITTDGTTNPRGGPR